MFNKLKIADYATLMNLVCGSVVIYFAFKGYLLYASIAILLGVFFDFIDGKIARFTKQESDLGAELDSFSDLVTFGLAPAFLMINLYPSNNYILVFSFLLPICGAMRLARFNINRKILPGYFIGVPITVNGIIFPIVYFASPYSLIALVLIILMSSLMISSVKIKKVF